MGVVVVIISLLLLFIFIVIVTKLKIDITYKHSGDDDLIKIHFYAWKIKWYTFQVPVIKMGNRSPEMILKGKSDSTVAEKKKTLKVNSRTIKKSIAKLNFYMHHIVHLKRIVIRFLKRVQIEKLEWNSSISVADAAMTGKLYGLVWVLKVHLVHLLTHFVRMNRLPILHVDANFHEKRSKTDFSCMISFRLGHAIIALFTIVKQLRRNETKK